MKSHVLMLFATLICSNTIYANTNEAEFFKNNGYVVVKNFFDEQMFFCKKNI